MGKERKQLQLVLCYSCEKYPTLRKDTDLCTDPVEVTTGRLWRRRPELRLVQHLGCKAQCCRSVLVDAVKAVPQALFCSLRKRYVSGSCARPEGSLVMQSCYLTPSGHGSGCNTCTEKLISAPQKSAISGTILKPRPQIAV